MSNELTLQDVHKDHSKKEIHRIYYESFNSQERFPFDLMFKHSQNKDNMLYSIHSGNSVIGFIYVIYTDTVLYIEYLAISNVYRDHGCGTAILAEIRALYPNKAILIDIEIEEHNPELYLRRKHFYTANGFIKTPYRLMFDDNSMEELWTTDPSLVIDSNLLNSLFSKQFTDKDWITMKEHLPILIS